MAMDKDQDLALKAPVRLRTKAQIQSAYIEMDYRLKSRCEGLLGISHNGTKRHHIDTDMAVTYLHRTVRDFLVGPETRRLLAEPLLMLSTPIWHSSSPPSCSLKWWFIQRKYLPRHSKLLGNASSSSRYLNLEALSWFCRQRVRFKRQCYRTVCISIWYC